MPARNICPHTSTPPHPPPPSPTKALADEDGEGGEEEADVGWHTDSKEEELLASSVRGGEGGGRDPTFFLVSRLIFLIVVDGVSCAAEEDSLPIMRCLTASLLHVGMCYMFRLTGGPQIPQQQELASPPCSQEKSLFQQPFSK